MTNEQAKSELMQLYGSLSEEKKQALDVLMAQADGEYISREAVIDIIEDVCPIYGNDYRYILREKVNELPIKAIPSVEPKTDNALDMKLKLIEANVNGYSQGLKDASNTEQEPKKCKDCKWWKDSDGTYRRGVRAESQCPINHKEVFKGNGYCFLFEPRKKEE